MPPVGRNGISGMLPTAVVMIQFILTILQCKGSTATATITARSKYIIIVYPLISPSYVTILLQRLQAQIETILEEMSFFKKSPSS